MSAIARLGNNLEIDNVTVGRNLNVAVIRGFAKLDELALISRADVFDQIANPFGTQRDPSKPHARQVLDYALGSLVQPADTSPRAFPEIILNARDAEALKIFIGDGDEEVEFNSSEGISFDVQRGRLSIDVARAVDSNSQPIFSRVDGNHRLLLVEEEVENDEDAEFPFVPFSLFVGLSPDQERSIFRDINGEQKRMEVAHLDQIQIKLKSGASLLTNDSDEALWIANELASAGHPFSGMVFMGGSKKGFKAAGATVPPININSLKSAVLATLKKSDHISTLLIAGISEDVLLANAGTKLELLSRFWTSVKSHLPTAWQDKQNYVLMQSIGLTSFSQLAANVIDELIEKKTVQQSDFDAVLSHIASKIDLAKSRWAGFAGAAGTKEVFKELMRVKNEGFGAAQILAQLNQPSTSPLDAD